MYKRLLKIPDSLDKSFFLFGPRGTGKTWWVKESFADSIYLDLLDTHLYMELKSDPIRINNYIPTNNSKWIIIDEVQKVPALLNEVHRLIEEKGYKFILTGSSARSLRKKGVNLLAGRALIYNMYPLTVMELNDDFNLNNILNYGELPSIFGSANPKKYLQAYVKTYLQEEVMQEGLTRNLSAFSKFLEIASFSQGSMLNMSAIAREIGIDQKTVIQYFDILYDLLLARSLPIFTKRAQRKVVAHSKFYFFDVGVFQTLRPKGPLDVPTEIHGIALESLFLQELIAINNYFDLEFQFYFWRTRHGVEVDIIAYGAQGLIAFEVKSKSYVDKKDLKGLKTFKSDYPVAKLYLIYNGDKKLYFEDIEVLPINWALKNLLNILKQ